MSSYPATVSGDLDLRLIVPGGESLPVASTARYEPTDPYAVHVTFRTGEPDDPTVEWSFARQLLTDGVTRSVGEGDVQVWPRGEGKTVCLALSSPSGQALFEVPLGALVEFLTRTYAAVPTGSESDYLDVDSELAMLLWSDEAGA